MIKKSVLNASWDGKFAEEILEDPQAPKGLLKCNQCGTCTANCPAARFTSYNPARLVRDVLAGAREKVLSSADIWQCFYCYTCHANCPRGNSPTELVRILRLKALAQGHAKEEVARFLAFGECFAEFGIGGMPSDIVESHANEFGHRWVKMRLHIDDLREVLGLQAMGLPENAQKQLKSLLHHTGFMERLQRLSSDSEICQSRGMR
ncbi:MAG: heterodisulfide reductase subunit C [Candidatus Methanoperedenaceae archaeon]|nr:MAG: heterodisulfide reductase subunit C [Candidatus Methanoperedenaceae archaeon]